MLRSLLSPLSNCGRAVLPNQSLWSLQCRGSHVAAEFSLISEGAPVLLKPGCGGLVPAAEYPISVAVPEDRGGLDSATGADMTHEAKVKGPPSDLPGPAALIIGDSGDGRKPLRRRSRPPTRCQP